MLLDPGHDPLRRYLFGQGARTGVVHQDFAGAFGAEFGQQLVKANAAMAVSIFVGAIAERDHSVGHAGQVRLLSFQTAEQCLRVVGHIALAVGRGANQEGAAALKDAGVEAIHHPDGRLMASRFQRLLHLLRHHLGRAGHGAHQDRDARRPMLCRPSPQALLYVRLRKYNASTVSRKRDIVHAGGERAGESPLPAASPLAAIPTPNISGCSASGCARPAPVAA